MQRVKLRPLVKSAYQKVNFLFLSQNICCGYSKEPSKWDGSFEQPKHMLKTDGLGKIYNFTLKNFVCPNLWELWFCFVFQPMWVLNEDSTAMIQRDITFVPGLYKIFDEILGEWK